MSLHDIPSDNRGQIHDVAQLDGLCKSTLLTKPGRTSLTSLLLSRTAASDSKAATDVALQSMNEAGDRPGEASHDVSPILENDSQITTHPLCNHDMGPSLMAEPAVADPNSSTAAPADQNQVTTQEPVYAPERFSTTGAPHSQFLQQLANTLRLESLALKSQTTGPAKYFFNDQSPAPLEADSDAEDIENDPVFQKYQKDVILRRRRTQNPSSPTDYVISADSRHNIDAVHTQASGRPRSQTLPSELAQGDQMLEVDRMDTDEGRESSPQLLPLVPDDDASVSRHKLRLSGGIRKTGDFIFYRRSAQVAALCPLVVHKAARMRKRSKSTTKCGTLPRSGKKGEAVAAQLDESASAH